MLRLLPLLCCHGVVFLLGDDDISFSLSFFTLFSLRASFSQILSKNRLDRRKPRQENTERSGERDLKMFDLSLSLKKDWLSFLLRALMMSLSRCSLVIKSFFVTSFLSHSSWLLLVSCRTNERMNEWFQSVSLIFVFSDPMCVRLKRLSVFWRTRRRHEWNSFVLSLSLCLSLAL